MENEMISIIVPVYNVAEYLNQCLDSIINQTYDNLEVVLVNDGSTDNSLEICLDYENRDKRIKLINQVNKGLSEARNAGIDTAKGNYIGFVDSDDFIEPTMYQHLYEALKLFKADISTCGRYVYADRVIGKQYTKKEAAVYSIPNAIKAVLEGDSMDVAAWDKLYSASLFDNIRFPIGEVNEDTAVFYKIFDKADSVVHTGTTEYYYRKRIGSITKGSFSVAKSQLVDRHLRDLRDFIQGNYPELKKSCDMYISKSNFPLFLHGVQSDDLSEEQRLEVGRRYNTFKKYYRYYILNPNNKTKNKVIAVMIRIHIYNIYYKAKKMIKGKG